MDRRFGGWGEGKGKAPRPQKEKGKLPGPKREKGKGKGGPRKLRSNSTRQPDRVYAHTNETKRFPGGAPTNLRYIYIYIYYIYLFLYVFLFGCVQEAWNMKTKKTNPTSFSETTVLLGWGSMLIPGFRSPSQSILPAHLRPCCPSYLPSCLPFCCPSCPSCLPSCLPSCPS